MTIMRLKGLKKYYEPKAAKWYYYHRKSGRPITAEWRTAAFAAELARIEEEFSGRGEAKKGTLGPLIASYKATSKFTELKPRTKSDYQKVFDYLQPLAPAPLLEMTPGWVARLREAAFKKRKRRFANYVLAVLSVLLSHAVELELLTSNPVASVKKVRRPKGMPDANRPWTKEECDAVIAAAPIHLKVVIGLCMYTGMREGDALSATWSIYKDGAISTVTNKAGVPIWWPCPSKLTAILKDAIRGDALQIALTSRRTPWTESGFQSSWRKFRLELEKQGKVQPKLTIHGLRHTVGTLLREEGFDYRSIADALGQNDTKMAEHYSKGADLKKKMVGVGAALERAQNGSGTKDV